MKNKTGIRIDFENAVIEMSKAFSEKAAIFGSDCYQALQRAREDYPTFTVSIRGIKKCDSKETYKGLTFEKMEDYILKRPDSEKHLAEYNEIRQIADLHTTHYPHVKKWFLETYPEVKNFTLTNPDTAAASSEASVKDIDTVSKIESLDSPVPKAA